MDDVSARAMREDRLESQERMSSRDAADFASEASDSPALPAALIERHPLLSKISLEQRIKMLRLGKLVTTRARKTILRQNTPSDSVHFLLEGSVRIFHCDGDKQLLVKLMAAPAVFGEIEAVTGRPCIDSVITVERSLAWVIPAHVFRFLLDHERGFSSAIARDLAERLTIAAANQSSLAFDDVEARLAGLLVDYAAFAGENVAGGVRIQSPITQNSLAQDLGVSRKAVADVLSRFRARGLLCKEQARYQLPDIEALSACRMRRIGFHRSV